jgi:hypothetical protein
MVGGIWGREVRMHVVAHLFAAGDDVYLDQLNI